MRAREREVLPQYSRHPSTCQKKSGRLRFLPSKRNAHRDSGADLMKPSFGRINSPALFDASHAIQTPYPRTQQPPPMFKNIRYPRSDIESICMKMQTTERESVPPPRFLPATHRSDSRIELHIIYANHAPTRKRLGVHGSSNSHWLCEIQAGPNSYGISF